MQIAVSSWALHRTIGVSWKNSPEANDFVASNHSAAQTDLLSLPALLRDRGYERLELCHFHLKSREPVYLREVRSALADERITLQTLLIDDGDISSPSTETRDKAWIASWIEAGLLLGAEAARVIAGKQVWGEETFLRSTNSLLELARLGLHLRIENWHDLLQTPQHVHRLLDRLEDQVGLCMDFGNWSRPNKYDDLAQIAERAETCHAKAEFTSSTILDEEDFRRCLVLSRDAGYSGPFVLVNGGTLPDEWDALEIQRAFCLRTWLQ